MLARLALITAVLFCYGTEAHSSYKIMIDPGHGGSDHGAVRDGLREADIVLSVSKKLAELLEKDGGFSAQLTRTSSSQELSLRERVQKAEEFKANIFLSIHANASTDSRVKGVEFYFAPALSGQEARLWLNHLSVQAQSELSTSEDRPEKEFTSDVDIILHSLKDQHRAWESQEISRSLWSQWTLSGQRKTVRQAPFYVVNSNKVPSVLVEIGYLSHPKERKRLIRPDHQEQIAQEIFQGLKQFKESMDNSGKTDLE